MTKPSVTQGWGTSGAGAATPPGLALLRQPFPANQISVLPKPYTRDSPKGKCAECGGYHGLPAVHLDYVGHAALTDRLLDADPVWTWEPVPDPKGLGLPVSEGGLWIRLTVCGVTRLGYGCADGKKGGDAVKEVIGDALRNAAMRFGAALDLWHKGQLHDVDDGDWQRNAAAPPATKPQASRTRPVARPEAPKAPQRPAEVSRALQEAPEGYEAWLKVLEGITANGEQEFDAALAQSKQDYVKVLRETAPKTLASLRTRARKVK